jgi:hypothetical protein
MSHIRTQPPSRLATSVPLHSLSSCATLARFAATVVTGTRKPSVNSSLRPSSSARNPIENASPPISGLPVASRTAR